MKVLATVWLISFGIFLVDSLATSGIWFNTIVIITFENKVTYVIRVPTIQKAYTEVSSDENFDHWSSLGRTLSNFYAITHPSQPNYFSQIGGDYFGWSSDANKNISATNVVDLLDSKGVTWKAYQENWPRACFTGNASPYVRKHNPFISFLNIQLNSTRCANIVDATQLDTDLASGNLPQYIYYTPNLNNDAHDTDLAYAGNWLTGWLVPKIPKFPSKTLIYLTFDEDDGAENNHIYTVVIGSMIPAGSAPDTTHYNHYSLLATVEKNWGLGNLGRNDVGAPIIKLEVTP